MRTKTTHDEMNDLECSNEILLKIKQKCRFQILIMSTVLNIVIQIWLWFENKNEAKIILIKMIHLLTFGLD